jgi:hypothetical protein
MGNILGFGWGGGLQSGGRVHMGMELLHCNNNYGSAARAKYDQNG